MNPNAPTSTEHLRWLADRLEGACIIETDPKGVLTHFGRAAEIFFRCNASEALGKLNYKTFHDSEEMKTCQGDPEFLAAMEDPGWTEGDWKIVLNTGERFSARVTLLKLSPGESIAPEGGWLALYQKR